MLSRNLQVAKALDNGVSLLTKGSAVAATGFMPVFTKQTHFVKVVPRGTRDVHIYCYGWWTLSSALRAAW